MTRTGDDATAVHEVTSHDDRPGPSPTLPGAPITPSPPPGRSAAGHDTHQGRPGLSAAAVAS